MTTLSKVRQINDRKSIFLITQTFSGIKDLLILNKSKIFSDQYVKSVQASSAANSKNYSFGPSSKKYSRTFPNWWHSRNIDLSPNG